VSVEDERQVAASRFVESFAALMVEAGMARMPARVFAQLLVAESGRATSAELTEALKVSPAAISGAVRYLLLATLITKESEPGSRRDVYLLRDDVWYETLRARATLMERWLTVLGSGVETLGSGTAAGRRLQEHTLFYEFMRKHTLNAAEEWRDLLRDYRRESHRS
jgi:DNA-binding transcriptional regulator GbsR (MarR family)